MIALSSIVAVILSFGLVSNPTYKVIESAAYYERTVSASIVSVERDAVSTKIVVEYSATKLTRFKIPHNYSLTYKKDGSYFLLKQKNGTKRTKKKAIVRRYSPYSQVVEFDAIPESTQAVDMLVGPESAFNFVEIDLTKSGIANPTVVEAVHESQIFTPASFLGYGIDAFAQWVDLSIKYPLAARANHNYGVVLLNISIDEEGIVSANIIERSVDTSLDEEALRVVNSSPAWSPLLVRGIPCKTSFEFPVYFSYRRY